MKQKKELLVRYNIAIYKRNKGTYNTYIGYAELLDEDDAHVLLEGYRLAGAEVCEGTKGKYVTDYFVHVTEQANA